MNDCPTCHGRTFIWNADTEVWAPCECRLKKDKEDFLDMKLKGSYIPKYYTRHDVASYKKLIRPGDLEANAHSLQVIEAIVENPLVFIDNYRVLWIWGADSNSGHTTFAVMVGMALIEKGFKVRFIEMQTLVNNFTNFEMKDQFFAELAGYDVFIIDDAFDSTRTSISDGYGRVQLFQFINNSFNNDKTFIMTSNVPLSSISSEKDGKYEQCRIVLQRSILSLEFKGTLFLDNNKDFLDKLSRQSPFPKGKGLNREV